MGTDMSKEHLLFRDWFKAEQEAASHKAELDKHTARLKIAISKAESRAEAARDAIARLMKETGQYEIVLSGEVSDYVIAYSTPRESVKGDVMAAPEEFVVVERKLKKKEVGDYLKKLREEGKDFPNWASFERGEPVLQWKATKKKADVA